MKTLLPGEAPERNAGMKNALAQDTCKGFMLQQRRGIRQLRGRQHSAPASSPLMPGRGKLSHALGAVLALALLLFALPGMGAAITGASVRTPNQLSARSLATRPT